MGKDKLIMLVCPNRTRSLILKNCLIRAGIKPERIVEVDGISSALVNLMAREFAIIFSDHNGAINGVEFLRQVRTLENGRFEDIPFVIIAKKGSPEDVVEAGKLGVKSFILFDPPVTTESEFLKKLGSVLIRV